MKLKVYKAREGDFLETREGLIFDVKGLVHPPRKIIAYLRYFEDPLGTRRRGGKKYSKVYSLSDRERILREKFPPYLFYDPVFGENMQGVPHTQVSKLYQPAEKVSCLLSKDDLDPLESLAVEFVEIVHDAASVRFSKLGISGSILVDLHTEDSDIDIIVYGRENCIRAYEALGTLMQEKCSPVSAYSTEDLKALYAFRSKDTWMPLEDFIKVERRKSSQGKFKGKDFFVRFILDWDEVNEKYGDRLYSRAGYTRIKAKIEDDSESMFTPCRYALSDVEVLSGTAASPIKEIVSFRGRFAKQAEKGEHIVAQGKLEKVAEKDGTEFFRLVLGAKPFDFMINKSL